MADPQQAINLEHGLHDRMFDGIGWQTQRASGARFSKKRWHSQSHTRWHVSNSTMLRESGHGDDRMSRPGINCGVTGPV